MVCRSCHCGGLLPVLDLGEMPLANGLIDARQLDEPEPTWPLEVVFCPECALVQITETVCPELLFSEYMYFSSVSDALLAHSRAHVEVLVKSRQLGPENQVVEIASNDGYLLQYFAEFGVGALGIEPAANVAEVARARGVQTRTAFFGPDLARELRGEGQTADVVLGNNVLAHVPDLNGVVSGAALLLRDGGIVEFEFPYVVDLVDHLEFDTIYHEHLCYFSVHAVNRLFARNGLVLTDVLRLPVHGGSLRVTGRLAKEGPAPHPRVSEALAMERSRGVDTIAFYTQLAPRVDALGIQLRRCLERLRTSGKRIAAYGASAKGATLLNAFGIGRDFLEYVVDRNPVKQGFLTPGTHLEIRAPRVLTTDRPDYALLLTWNFAAEVLAQQAGYRGSGGHFILPVPEVCIV